jgi:hypothetical protein
MSTLHTCSVERDKALSLLTKVLEAREGGAWKRDPSTLTCIANASAILANIGVWKAAEDLGVQVLAMRREVLGEDYPNTLLSLVNLAAIYQSQAQYLEAERQQLQALDKMKVSLGENHWSMCMILALSIYIPIFYSAF